jgi:hypothetical protein
MRWPLYHVMARAWPTHLGYLLTATSGLFVLLQWRVARR